MSQEMQITIAAKDEASKVMKGIEQKVKKFGSDFGRSMASIVAPMTLVNFGLGKMQEYMADIAKKKEDAFNWGASLEASAEKINVTVKEFQALQAAASETGISIDQVAKAYEVVLEQLRKAREGDPKAIFGLDAIGIGIDDLKKATPEDVFKAVSLALSTIVDPAERAELAITALGSSAKGLQEVLKKGFDIAGAFVNTDGLTPEEAGALRALETAKRAKENKEKLKEAKKQGVGALLAFDPSLMDAAFADDTPLQKKTREASLNKDPIIRAQQLEGMIGGDTKLQEKVIEAARKKEEDRKAEEERKNIKGREAAERLRFGKKMQDALEAEDKKKQEMAEKKAKDDAANAERREKSIASTTRKQADELAKQFEKETALKEDKDKESTAKKSSGLTVSSLREIGGAMAGENMGGAMDVQTEQLNTQKKMVEELSELNEFIRRQPTNFTLPGAGPTMIG